MSADTLLKTDDLPEETAPAPTCTLPPSTLFFLDYTEFMYIRAEGMCDVL
jgi:hypothetical protein